MANDFDWDAYDDAPNNNAPQFDWDQFQDASRSDRSSTMPNANLELLKSAWHGGIPGANRGFSKIFGWGEHQKQMQEAYDRAKQEYPIAAPAGNFLAQLYSAAPFVASGIGGAQALTGGRAAGMFGRYAQNIVGSGLGGLGFGALETPDEGQTKGENMKSRAGQFALGEAIAAPIIGAATRGPRMVRDYARSLNPNLVAEDVAQNFIGRRQGYRDAYTGALNAPGIRNPAQAPNAFNPQTQANQEAIRTLMRESESYTPRLQEFLDNPTPENLHWARSDLDRLIDWVTKHERTALPGMKEARTAARQINEQLNPIMEWTLEGAGPEAGAAYQALGPGYRRDIIPHDQELINAINQFMRDEIGGHNVLNRARNTKNDVYGHRYGDEIPGIDRAINENPWQNIPGIEQFLRIIKKQIPGAGDL